MVGVLETRVKEVEAVIEGPESAAVYRAMRRAE